MKSAIVVVTQSRAFDDFLKHFDPDKVPGAKRISENVWQIDMQQPEGLVTLLHHARDMEYRLFYLDEVPDWIEHAGKTPS